MKKFNSDSEELEYYRKLRKEGRLLEIPCKVGNAVYVDSSVIPIKHLSYYIEDEKDIPLYFPGRVVSFRFAKRNFAKIAVKGKWEFEVSDSELGLYGEYIYCERNITLPLSSFGKTILLAEKERK